MTRAVRGLASKIPIGPSICAEENGHAILRSNQRQWAATNYKKGNTTRILGHLEVVKHHFSFFLQSVIPSLLILLRKSTEIMCEIPQLLCLPRACSFSILGAGFSRRVNIPMDSLTGPTSSNGSKMLKAPSYH